MHVYYNSKFEFEVAFLFIYNYNMTWHIHLKLIQPKKSTQPRIEINPIMIKPKLKSILKFNLISLLRIHHFRLSLNPIITAKTRVNCFK
jgi:hypothetical protein